MGWKNWSYVRKGFVIGVIIWLIVIVFFKVSGLMSPEEIPIGLEGYCGYNSFQDSILKALFIIGFPLIFLGGPCLSTIGPTGVWGFWIGSFISFILWGLLIGWIYGKIKSRNKGVK